jgi:hypothetical protein
MTPRGTAAARRTRRREAVSHARAPAPGAPRIAPRGPRRVSGPGPRRAVRAQPAPTRGARLLAWLRALPDHRLTDRLVRGRAWIVVVGFLLIGIVAMQVTLLRLNSGIGRAVAQSANLERRNGELRAAVSRLSAEQRVQAMGAKLGLIAPDAGRVTYLTSRGSADSVAAANALRANQAAAASPATGSGQRVGPSSDTPAGPDQAATTASERSAPDSGGAPPAGGAPADSAPAAQAAPTDPASAGAGAIAAAGR